MTWWRAWAGRYNKVRPTVAGLWYLVVLAGVTLGALNTGNNLVYLVLAGLLGLLIVNNALAEWNLRGLIPRRRLPAELFAGVGASGSLVLENPRRWGSALSIELEERDGGAARARFSRVGPRAEAEAPATWTFPVRGLTGFAAIRVGSTYPFGLLRRFRDIDVPGEALIFPTPEREPPPVAAAGDGPGAATRGGADATGEFVGLRPYSAGDPVRRIHWPLSARAQSPLVVVRAGEAGSEVVVELDRAAPGPRREKAIGRACGRVLFHASRGDAVGLRVEDTLFAPSTGNAHRRLLLATLATLPADT